MSELQPCLSSIWTSLVCSRTNKIYLSLYYLFLPYLSMNPFPETSMINPLLKVKQIVTHPTSYSFSLHQAFPCFHPFDIRVLFLPKSHSLLFCYCCCLLLLGMRMRMLLLLLLVVLCCCVLHTLMNENFIQTSKCITTSN